MSTDLIAAGRHNGVCRSIQWTTTKTNNDEMVVVGFEILDGPDAGKHLSYFGMFTEKTIDFTVEALRNCGWEGDDVSELAALAEAGKLANEVSLVVEHEEYEGEWKAKIRWVNRKGGKLKLERPMDERDLTRFAQSMKSRIRAAGRDNGGGSKRPANGGGTKRQQAPHPNAPGGAFDTYRGNGPDDDIPF